MATIDNSNIMDERLREAALTGNFNYFYSLQGKASLLKAIETEFFAETPLHVAAAAGQIAFAMEMMNLRPEFARTLNEDGFSPMHLALQNKKTQLVYRLLEMDKDLVRVKGREGKTPFHWVVEGGDENLLTKFLDACPECIHDVTVHGDTAFHIALKCDKSETFAFLVNWVLNSVHEDADQGWEERVLNCKDEQGNTPLHIAAIKNNLEAIKLLSVECLDIVDVNAKNAENLKALEFISKSDEKDENQSKNEGEVVEMDSRSEIKRLLEVQGAYQCDSSVSGRCRDPRLMKAARTGNVNYLYSLIQKKPSLLKDIDTEYFAETPLHVAASEGQIAFAVEMMNLRPEFARTLNKAGLSPMHVALVNKNTQLVYRLLEMDKDLVRVRGREGKTPFHFVVEQQRQRNESKSDQIREEMELLTKFLDACPECIKDVTAHGDTAVHIALKCNKFETFKFLVRWVLSSVHKDAEDWEERVFRGNDEEGNTLLQIAAIQKNSEVVELLRKVYYNDVFDEDDENFKNLTARPESISSICDESERERHVDTRSRTISPHRSFLQFHADVMRRYKELLEMGPPRPLMYIRRSRRNISDDTRNALLVVIVLIITATYQSALSPSGGVWQGDNSTSSSSDGISTNSTTTVGLGASGELHVPGTTVMRKNTFILIWTYNTLSLLITLGLTVYLLPSGPVSFLLLTPLLLLCSSYMLSMSVVSPSPHWSKVNKILSIVILLLMIYMAALYIVPVLFESRQKGYSGRRRRFIIFLQRFILYTLVSYLVIALCIVAGVYFK